MRFSYYLIALTLGALLLAGCSKDSNTTTGSTSGSAVEETPPLDPAKAAEHAKTFLATLFPDSDVNGPICLPEEVVDGYTQCSYTMAAKVVEPAEGEESAAPEVKIGTLLCNNAGCMEGDAPALMAEEMAADAMAQANANTNSGGSGSTHHYHHNSYSDDWLFWYLLYNNGGTTYRYNSWYDSTPVVHRTAYYSTTYVPSTDSVSSYRTNYGTSVRTNSTTKYATKTKTGRSSGYGNSSGRTSGTNKSTTSSSSSNKSSGSSSSSSSSSSGSASSASNNNSGSSSGSSSSNKPKSSGSSTSSNKNKGRSSGYGSSRGRSSGSRGRRSNDIYKFDIEYVDPGLYAEQALSMPLATWRYMDDPDDVYLGVITQDVPDSVVVLDNGDQIDLYTYASMAIAASQVQQAEINELRAMVEQLSAECAR